MKFAGKSFLWRNTLARPEPVRSPQMPEKYKSNAANIWFY
jgi:hypothetical protein